MPKSEKNVTEEIVRQDLIFDQIWESGEMRLFLRERG